MQHTELYNIYISDHFAVFVFCATTRLSQIQFSHTVEEMKHLHIEVKLTPKSEGTKWKLSKSGIVDFGGNCGPKQHHQ